jgi:hypothetical protein
MDSGYLVTFLAEIDQFKAQRRSEQSVKCGDRAARSVRVVGWACERNDLGQLGYRDCARNIARLRSFAKDELAYLAPTSKIENPIRGRRTLHACERAVPPE